MASSSTDSHSAETPAKAAHLNMMTDTLIANMRPDGLRSILRGLLVENAQVTAGLHRLATKYLENTRPSSIPHLFTSSNRCVKPTAELQKIQGRYRCLMGCGMGFESMQLLTTVIQQLQELEWVKSIHDNDSEELLDVLATVDGDVVQATTAVHKSLLTSSGIRPMECEDAKIIARLRAVLYTCKNDAKSSGQDFAFERGLCCLEKLLYGGSSEGQVESGGNPLTNGFHSTKLALESFQLGRAEVPRMFMGLWQFSSPAWGTASRGKIDRHFRKHVDAGLIAYDMADHYGDAESSFGQFRSAQADSESIFCATKWAVFQPIRVTKEAVDETIAERLTAINATRVELLQFHWQDYHDKQYLAAARLIEEHPRVTNLGLCNFDTEHMEELLDNGVHAVSNQRIIAATLPTSDAYLHFQFSLIDLRPTFKMADVCRKHNVKLLTYGSLCGGFLADKWLDKSAPNLFDQNMTPSHRKYFEMITIWGGWLLFQELLQVLSSIGSKYSVSISSVAIRWVLDHDYVGAVIIGARMGISEHIEENLKALSFKLDEEDEAKIKTILDRSRAKDVFETMGDCGAEYRHTYIRRSRIRRNLHRNEDRNSPTTSTKMAGSKTTGVELREEPKVSSIASVPVHTILTSDPSGSQTWSNEGLQQVGILSREAQFGKFSLENILSVPSVLRPTPPTRSETRSAEYFNDPITCNMLSFPVALGLFDSQLDPKLHTFEYVRQKSPFLLTAILAASSKAFHPGLHPTLRSHTENLLGKAFAKGTKSVETVQAILIFTYWKEPDEIRTWLLVGYAIRMCIELGWHELVPVARKATTTSDEIAIREARNVERTWLVLFVYDRSLSLQLGKPWMIETTDLITGARDWHQEPYAVPGGDMLLSAFVCLRLISADMLDLPSRSSSSRMRLLRGKKTGYHFLITVRHFQLVQDSVAPTQRFLVHFYGSHLRLLLNSYALQNSLKGIRTRNSISHSALWLCSSSAICMLEHISKEFGPLKQLYFVQDSVHVMTAYAAIFLIKLLASLPKSLQADLETHSTRAILQAAETFSQQCATQITGCAMQSRFLRSLVEKYYSLQTQGVTAGSLPPVNNDLNADANPVNQAARTVPGVRDEDTRLDTDLNLHLTTDKDIWETLFTDAGFWMSEGMFPNDNLGGNGNFGSN
ncbi:aldo keto reductase protein [Rutstroemia sp. NJR-2017a BBW]|nr:aldo keto reductase protein [Rutstroemia sp. NJR-2017a BBW]